MRSYRLLMKTIEMECPAKSLRSFVNATLKDADSVAIVPHPESEKTYLLYRTTADVGRLARTQLIGEIEIREMVE